MILTSCGSKAAGPKSADPKSADPKSAPHGNVAKGTEERRFTINDAGSATIRGVGANDVTWQFTAIPDRPPTIALTKDPEVQARGTLQLSYKMEDDYGVVDARATFKLKSGAGLDGKSAPRTLFDAPEFPLALPQARTRHGVGPGTNEFRESSTTG